MSWIDTGTPSVRASAAAAIQPAVPPPMMTILRRRASSAMTPAPVAVTQNFTPNDLADGARKARDIADGIQSTANRSIRSDGVEIVDQVFLVGDVQHVDAQVERGDIADREVLGDLQIERLVTVVRAGDIGRGLAWRTVFVKVRGPRDRR